MPLTRSQQMARIRGRNTRPERMLRRAMWSRGLRFRIHLRTRFGSPDIVFLRARLAVFVDGCFWHGCPDHYVRPRSRDDFWREKLRRNVERDARQTLALEAEGWRVLRLWEHEVVDDLDAATERVVVALADEQPIQQAPRVIRVVSTDPAADLERRELVDLHDVGTVTDTREGVRITKSR